MSKPDQTIAPGGRDYRLGRVAGVPAVSGGSAADNFINAVLFQLNWFACVVGGVTGRLWIPSATLSLMLLLSVRQQTRREDVYLFIAAAMTGAVLDSIWIGLGILDFGGEGAAPVWIVMMWMGVALTINHSLRWLHDRPLLGGLLAAAAAPLCYLGGERLGAVQVDPAGLPLIALSWLLLFSTCFWWVRQRFARGLP